MDIPKTLFATMVKNARMDIQAATPPADTL